MPRRPPPIPRTRDYTEIRPTSDSQPSSAVDPPQLDRVTRAVMAKRTKQIVRTQPPINSAGNVKLHDTATALSFNPRNTGKDLFLRLALLSLWNLGSGSG